MLMQCNIPLPLDDNEYMVNVCILKHCDTFLYNFKTHFPNIIEIKDHKVRTVILLPKNTD